MHPERVTVLAGGVGAARFLQGVVEVVPPSAVTVIGNVGDDLEVHGLHVSPDLDTVLYTLTGEIDPERGWGVREDSSRALERARALGADAWFWLGDLDIGLHMARTEWLRTGQPLSAVTARLGEALGLGVRLVPATDDRLRTMVGVDGDEIDFQTYYVRHAHRDAVRSLRFDGAEGSAPAPGVLEALAAPAIVVAPSNPLISVGPILAVPGVREAIRDRQGRCVAVSPIVAGEAIRGPAADMLRSLGHEASAIGVARLYEGVCDVFVLDRADAGLVPQVEALGMRAVVADAIMRDSRARRDLAAEALRAAGIGV